MRFSIDYRISIEILLLCRYLQEQDKVVNSKSLSLYLGLPASSIRDIMSKLSASGLIHSKIGGAGGIELLKPLDEITAYDVYVAVEDKGSLMRFDQHKTINENRLRVLIENDSLDVEKAMEERLKAYALSSYYDDYTKELDLE